MAARTYVNLDLTIRPDGTGYAATAAVGDSTFEHAFELPVDRSELERFKGMFGQAQLRRIESPRMEHVRALGGRLFDAVFDDPMETFFAEQLATAEGQAKGLRIRLRLDEAPELVSIPWEYLYRSHTDDFPATSNWTPIVRYMADYDGLPPAPFDGPLRILVMVSDPIETRATIQAEREWERLEQAMDHLISSHQVTLTRLDRATMPDLANELLRNDYHVFHYIGHGEYDAKEHDGVLFMEDARGRTAIVTGRTLGTALRDARSMRMAVLNSCEGATVSAVDPMAGSAQSLIRKGLPAVVAMQYGVTDSTAIVFSQALYQTIGRGFPIDAAMSEARKQIYFSPHAYEFGVPVLYMSASDGIVFEVDEELPTEPAVDVDVSGGTAPVEPRELVGAPPAAPVPDVDVPEDGPSDIESEDETDPSVSHAPQTFAGTVPPTEQESDVSGDQDDTSIDPNRRRLRSAALGVVAFLFLAGVIGAIIPDGPTTDTTSVTGSTIPGTTSPATGTTLDQQPDQRAQLEVYPATVADRVSKPPVIDGEDSDWASRYAFDIVEPVYQPELIDQPGDTGATVQLAWDEQWLYVFADVLDQSVQRVSDGSQLWRGDSLGLNFDSDPHDGFLDQLSQVDVQFNLSPPGYDSAAFPGVAWVRLQPNAKGTGFSSEGAITSGDAVTVASQQTASGYTLEARISWDAIGIAPPRPGDVHRMTVDISDNDDGSQNQGSMVSNSPLRTAENQARPRVWLPIVFDDGGSTDRLITTVPDVFGFPESEGVPLLTEAGLDVQLVTGCSSSVEAGAIRIVRFGGEPVVDRPSENLEPVVLPVGSEVGVLIGNGESC